MLYEDKYGRLYTLKDIYELSTQEIEERGLHHFENRYIHLHRNRKQLHLEG